MEEGDSKMDCQRMTPLKEVQWMRIRIGWRSTGSAAALGHQGGRTPHEGEAEEAEEGMTGAGEEEARIGVFIIKMNQVITGGSHGTTSQGQEVEMLRQEVMRTVASTRTEEGGGKSRTPRRPWIALGGRLPRAGPYGGHCPQTYRTITLKGREEEQAGGTDRRMSNQQPQSLLNRTLRLCRVTLLSQCWCLLTLSSSIITLLSPALEAQSQ